METAHVYMFSDASPTDWLTDGKNEEWHTIVNFSFQFDPKLLHLKDQCQSHEDFLPKDPIWQKVFRELITHISSKKLHKWSNSSHSYKRKFCEAISNELRRPNLKVSACSFQEKTLRNSEEALKNSYNNLIGGVEGKGIGFEEFVDDRGRLMMKHSFVNFFGFHEIHALKNQMLVLLLMSWFFGIQYKQFLNDIVGSKKYGFDSLNLTVVSDKLSGDDDTHPTREAMLRNLVDPEGEEIMVLTRSTKSDEFPGDLLVDNLAGLLNSGIVDSNKKFGKLIAELFPNNFWQGWHELVDSKIKLEFAPTKYRFSLD